MNREKCHWNFVRYHGICLISTLAFNSKEQSRYKVVYKLKVDWYKKTNTTGQKRHRLVKYWQSKSNNVGEKWQYDVIFNFVQFLLKILCFIHLQTPQNVQDAFTDTVIVPRPLPPNKGMNILILELYMYIECKDQWGWLKFACDRKERMFVKCMEFAQWNRNWCVIGTCT